MRAFYASCCAGGRQAKEAKSAKTALLAKAIAEAKTGEMEELEYQWAAAKGQVRYTDYPNVY